MATLDEDGDGEVDTREFIENMKRAKRERRYAQNRDSHSSHIGNRWLFPLTRVDFVFRASPGVGSPAAVENPAGAETTQAAAGSQEGAAASPQAPSLPVLKPKTPRQAAVETLSNAGWIRVLPKDGHDATAAAMASTMPVTSQQHGAHFQVDLDAMTSRFFRKPAPPSGPKHRSQPGGSASARAFVSLPATSVSVRPTSLHHHIALLHQRC